jgi:hypothetical protein
MHLEFDPRLSAPANTTGTNLARQAIVENVMRWLKLARSPQYPFGIYRDVAAVLEAEQDDHGLATRMINGWQEGAV